MSIRNLSARGVLLIGWLGFLLYAFPGYMSFDSIFQLRESRLGIYTEGHPPLMAAQWRLVELVIAGPIGMLLIQSACFLGGSYLIARRWMSPRKAAVCASLILWFPAVASTMAVIWKDSQMAGYLVLGTALLLDERRRVRVLGLAALWLATAMRHNAFAMTLPIIVLLFAWSPAARWWTRYPIAFAAWVAITVSVQMTSSALVVSKSHLWHEGMALFDITSTLRFVPDLPEADVNRMFEGVPLHTADDPQAIARRPVAEWNFAAEMWALTYETYVTPKTQEERDAVARTWRAVVLGHPWAYLTYRWHLFRQILQLVDVPEELRSSAIYYWYTDVQQPYESGQRAEHDASAGGIQGTLREIMWWFGTTSLFRTYVYVLLSLLLLPFCFRDRTLLALVTSGLIGEAALFILAPITDWRYSFWLVVSTLFVVVGVIARRANGMQTKPAKSDATIA